MSVREAVTAEEQPESRPQPGEMTILEHLIELRNRVVVASVAILVSMIITTVFATRIIDFLVEPAQEGLDTEDFRLIYTKPFGYVGSYFRVGLLGGITLAMPVVVYEALMYVSPALTKEEKRWVFPTVIGAALSFLGGAAFAYYVVLPPSLNFLLTFGEGTAEPLLEIGPYIDFVTRMIAAIGLSFETPLIIMFLARIGLISARKLVGWWRYAVVLSFVAGAIITPTIDPVTMTLVSVPIVFLYGIGTVLAAIFGRRTPRFPNTA